METIPVLELRHVTKTIRQKKLVENLSFQLNKGEVFGFLGPNGAGKTTTIRMIVGLSKISQGDVFINGYSISRDFKKAITNVGAIVENPDLYKYMTGYQNLKHFARMYPGIDKHRIYTAASMAGIDKRLQEKVNTYSLGMLQRLGLAQALMHKPSLIILDEPTNGLDPEGIHELRNELKELAHNAGVSVLVSSHLLSEVELMCDRVGIINGGKLVTVKTIADLTNTDSVVYLKIDKADINKTTELLNKFGKDILSVNDDSIAVKMDETETPKIIQILSGNGILIFGVDSKHKTLEESFLEMTEDNQ